MLSENTLVRVRKAVERLYTDVCDVVERRDYVDPKTKITRKNQEVKVYENLPCRVSFETVKAASETESASNVEQSVKLFVSPDVDIKSGSKVIVNRGGNIVEYSASGEPAVYSSHKEILLKIFKEWA